MDKITDHIPDVWFDWYARFLPGCFGASLYIYFAQPQLPALTATHLVVFAFFGYLAGHLVQPLSGWVVKVLEDRLNDNTKYKSASLSGQAVELLRKASKAHAEANSMCSMAIFLAASGILFPNRTNWAWVIMGTLYLLWSTVERVIARGRKIEDLSA